MRELICTTHRFPLLPSLGIMQHSCKQFYLVISASQPWWYLRIHKTLLMKCLSFCTQTVPILWCDFAPESPCSVSIRTQHFCTKLKSNQSFGNVTTFTLNVKLDIFLCTLHNLNDEKEVYM